MLSPVLPEAEHEDPLLRGRVRGLDFLAGLQQEDGSWSGDYGGPMFLLPMYVAATYIGRRKLPEAHRRRMIEYLPAVQNTDGSIGLHAEGPGVMFTTVLCYVALRLLGVDPADPHADRMRGWIREHGTALGCASWGKFVLALLNLYDYRGLHPISPELWLLPASAPMHPGRFWCHCRQVYLPMAYLYGRKAAAPLDPLLEQIRGEIYDRPYAEILFEDHRDNLAPTDRYVGTTALLRLTNAGLDRYEEVHLSSLRQWALDELLEHIRYEDRSTNYIRIGPVNAVLNTLVHVFAGPGESEVSDSFAALETYLCDGHDGMKMNGYNSTALWDTAFAAQAILATPERHRYHATLVRAQDFIRENQVIDELPRPQRFFRHRCRGGWPFSNRAHGWPITDCTAEGFKSSVELEPLGERPVPEDLLRESIGLILSFQNPNGGWSSYELQRGGRWLEWLNPSNVFADIMVDYSYVECTSACVQALALARRRFPSHLRHAVDRAIRKGVQFLLRQQRPDGSWEGSWAVCFTYGTWFGVWGLLAAGMSPAVRPIQRACHFLERNQRADGGWGEHFSSCLERRYVPLPQSQVVQTAWALLTLTRAGRASGGAAQRAVRFLLDRQQEDGDWPREALVGVFNKTTLINYENYRRIFPVWALGLVSHRPPHHPLGLVRH